MVKMVMQIFISRMASDTTDIEKKDLAQLTQLAQLMEVCQECQECHANF